MITSNSLENKLDIGNSKCENLEDTLTVNELSIYSNKSNKLPQIETKSNLLSMHSNLNKFKTKESNTSNSNLIIYNSQKTIESKKTNGFLINDEPINDKYSELSNSISDETKTPTVKSLMIIKLVN